MEWSASQLHRGRGCGVTGHGGSDRERQGNDVRIQEGILGYRLEKKKNKGGRLDICK